MARAEAGQAVQAEESLTVREHLEEAVLVEPAIDDLVEARWVVEDVPEAVLKVAQCLLEVVWHLVIKLGDQGMALIGTLVGGVGGATR